MALGIRCTLRRASAEHVDDLVMFELARAILDAGVSTSAVRRLFNLYADNLRRPATGEAELYQSDVQSPLQQQGVTEAFGVPPLSLRCYRRRSETASQSVICRARQPCRPSHRSCGSTTRPRRPRTSTSRSSADGPVPPPDEASRRSST